MNNSGYRKLIDFWCNELGRYGLTIPFIIGAEILLTNNYNFDIETLLQEIKNGEDIYFISNCNDLNEVVIGLKKNEYANLDSYKNYGSLYINYNELEKFENFEDILRYLNDNYSTYIAENKFSKKYDSAEWGNFSEQDLKYIENSKIK